MIFRECPVAAMEEGGVMRCRCLAAWWLLLLAVAFATSTAQTTTPSIVAWATATGGALHIEWCGEYY